MCFVITKKLYDVRFSSTPLHTVIEKNFSCSLLCLKVALQFYQIHLVEKLCTPLDSMASVVSSASPFTLAGSQGNGCLAGVGRGAYNLLQFIKTKCHLTSTMCKFLHYVKLDLNVAFPSC